MRQDPFYENSLGLDIASLPVKWVAQFGILSQDFLTASSLFIYMFLGIINQTRFNWRYFSTQSSSSPPPPPPPQMTSNHAHDAVLTLSRWMMGAVIIWPVRCVAVNSVGFVWKRSQTCITSGEMANGSIISYSYSVTDLGERRPKRHSCLSSQYRIRRL